MKAESSSFIAPELESSRNPQVRFFECLAVFELRLDIISRLNFGKGFGVQVYGI